MPRRRWFFAPFAFALFGSTFTHGSMVLALLFGLTGHARGASEGGHSGAGDTNVDVSLASEQTQAPVQTPPPPPPPSKDDEQAEPPPPPPPPPKQKPPAEANGGKLPGPVRIGLPSLGDGADTVEGQRALLPAATTCNDPVAGKWEALKFNPHIGMWVHFTLTVHHDASGALSGTILSRTWTGTVFDRVPPPCSLGSVDLTVIMNASGSAGANGRISFGASRYSVVSTRCVSLDTEYAPDHFTGTIDPARQEFQSLNNDGAFDVDAPYVLRRTGCL